MKAQEHACFVRGENDGWEAYERFRNLAREDAHEQNAYVSRLPEWSVLEWREATRERDQGG
jgi:hypothetical protein